eukprot:11147409-Alexandrium_andersonii.AAC.1
MVITPARAVNEACGRVRNLSAAQSTRPVRARPISTSETAIHLAKPAPSPRGGRSRSQRLLERPGD